MIHLVALGIDCINPINCIVNSYGIGTAGLGCKSDIVVHHKNARIISITITPSNKTIPYSTNRHEVDGIAISIVSITDNHSRNLIVQRGIDCETALARRSKGGIGLPLLVSQITLLTHTGNTKGNLTREVGESRGGNLWRNIGVQRYTFHPYTVIESPLPYCFHRVSDGDRLESMALMERTFTNCRHLVGNYQIAR